MGKRMGNMMVILRQTDSRLPNKQLLVETDLDWVKGIHFHRKGMERRIRM